ncbi:DsbC family protein [Massilia sp. CF038]|uniref:DsbC family protein n=1 Tax=Massilia sp. CF038 TaxID=1881045 RepID=UPI0009131BC2|nr:DsbC family protein [Massilia sp. CF038]SHH72011.1 Thiol:disulfide interchange protein DsbC [Massilia sp. CF038]
MLKTKFTLLALACAVVSCTAAENSADNNQKIEANLKKVLEPRLGDGAKIVSVKATPYAGLYEVVAGGNIVYTDKNGEYLIFGQVFNTRTTQNLTKERLEVVNKIKFNDLPFENALKMVKGDGKRVLAIFEDPNCGYCKHFRQTTLKEIDNVTVYTFMLNILSEDSLAKSNQIWCSADRNKAWDEWMLNGKMPATPSPQCETPHAKVSAVAQKYGINATPAIFFADGTRISGAVDLRGLEAKLKTVK